VSALRSKLMDPRSAFPLFDTERFTRNLEAAFVTVWERHVAGLAPHDIAIEATSTDLKPNETSRLISGPATDQN
jgi:hypothetical protein